MKRIYIPKPRKGYTIDRNSTYMATDKRNKVIERVAVWIKKEQAR